MAYPPTTMVFVGSILLWLLLSKSPRDWKMTTGLKRWLLGMMTRRMGSRGSLMGPLTPTKSSKGILQAKGKMIESGAQLARPIIVELVLTKRKDVTNVVKRVMRQKRVKIRLDVTDVVIRVTRLLSVPRKEMKKRRLSRQRLKPEHFR